MSRMEPNKRKKVPSWMQTLLDVLPVRGIIPPPERKEENEEKREVLFPLTPDQEAMDDQQAVGTETQSSMDIHEEERNEEMNTGISFMEALKNQVVKNHVQKVLSAEERARRERQILGDSVAEIPRGLIPRRKAKRGRFHRLPRYYRPMEKYFGGRIGKAKICEEVEDEDDMVKNVDEQKTENKVGSNNSLPVTLGPKENSKPEPVPVPENTDDYHGVEITEYITPEEPFIYITLEEGEIVSDFAMRKIWKRMLRTLEPQITC